MSKLTPTGSRLAERPGFPTSPNCCTHCRSALAREGIPTVSEDVAAGPASSRLKPVLMTLQALRRTGFSRERVGIAPLIEEVFKDSWLTPTGSRLAERPGSRHHQAVAPTVGARLPAKADSWAPHLQRLSPPWERACSRNGPVHPLNRGWANQAFARELFPQSAGEGREFRRSRLGLSNCSRASLR